MLAPDPPVPVTAACFTDADGVQAFVGTLTNDGEPGTKWKR